MRPVSPGSMSIGSCVIFAMTGLSSFTIGGSGSLIPTRWWTSPVSILRRSCHGLGAIPLPKPSPRSSATMRPSRISNRHHCRLGPRLSPPGSIQGQQGCSRKTSPQRTQSTMQNGSNPRSFPFAIEARPISSLGRSRVSMDFRHWVSVPCMLAET